MQVGGRLHRRVVEHKVTVAGDQKLDDLLVALARLDHLVDLGTQVMGEFGIRVGQRLVLADQAAQFLDEFFEVLLLCRSYRI